MAEPVHVRIGGQPWKTDPEQTGSVLDSGGRVISAPEAQQGSQAINDLSYVNQNWGDAGKFGMGALSGLTLGMGPGALAGMGMLDPGHLGAAQASGMYTAGDIAGTVAPALLSGGESLLGRGLSMTPAGLMTGAGSLAERLAGGMLGGSAGLLGRIGSAPIRMAARGAAEGALINMGHATGDALINNKPFSAEAILAAGGDGALFGGLMGGTLGLVGSLGSRAVEAVSEAGKGAVGRGVRGAGAVAKHLHVTDAVEADLAKGGRVDEFGKILHENGSGIGDSTSGQQAATKQFTEVQTAARKEAISAASKDATGALDNFEARLNPRLTSDIVAPRVGTASEAKAASEVQKFWDGFVSEKQSGRAVWNEANNFKSYAQWSEDGLGGELKGTAKRAAYDSYKQYADVQFADYSRGFKSAAAKEAFPKTWEGVINARDQLAKEIEAKASNPLVADSNTLKREILVSLDSEIKESMAKMAGGVGDKYAASTQNLKMAKELSGYLGKKATSDMLSTGSSVTGTDVGWAMTGAALGHPVGAIGLLAAKGISRKLMPKVENWMAQMAYNNSFGTKAASATQSLQSRIGTTLKNFIQGASKVPSKSAMVAHAEAYRDARAPMKFTRKSYEEMATKAEQLVSGNHQAQVQKYAEAMAKAGYTDLAQSMLDVNHRAVMYTIHTMPPREATKGMKSLKMHVPSKAPTLQEGKAGRSFRGISGGPHAFLDDLEKGKLSTDTARAVAYVYPEFMTEVVRGVANEIVELKAKGGYMPMDRISQLSVALNTPLDSSMEGDFVNAVQASLAAPDASQPKPPEPQQRGASIGQVGMAMMTPLQTITIGQT